MKFKISGTGLYTPPEIETSADISSRIGKSEQWIIEKSGVLEGFKEGEGEDGEQATADSTTNSTAEGEGEQEEGDEEPEPEAKEWEAPIKKAIDDHVADKHAE